MFRQLNFSSKGLGRKCTACHWLKHINHIQIHHVRRVWYVCSRLCWTWTSRTDYVFLTCTQHSWLNFVLSDFHVHDGCFDSLRIQIFTSSFLTTYSIHFPSAPFGPNIPSLSIPISHCNVTDTCFHLSKEKERDRETGQRCVRGKPAETGIS